MAYRPNDPNDPFVTQRPVDEPPPMTDPVLEPNRFEEDRSISGARIALYAVAVLAIVGALFYGMSATTNNTASPANSMAERPATPPPAVRDVTPRNNTEPGTTTGSAPAQTPPAAPAPANPAGSAQ